MLILAVSCRKELIEPPENLIGKEKMKEILYDMAVLYAAKGTNIGNLQIDTLTLETYIYERYQVDSLQFANSAVYYSSKPEEYMAIYEEIQERLKERRNRMQKERAKNKKSDSLARAERLKQDSLELGTEGTEEDPAEN